VDGEVEWQAGGVPGQLCAVIDWFQCRDDYGISRLFYGIFFLSFDSLPMLSRSSSGHPTPKYLLRTYYLYSSKRVHDVEKHMLYL